MNLGEFLVMLLAFTGAAVTVIWTIALAAGRAKRLGEGKSAGQLTEEEVEAIRAWLAEQDHTDTRVEQLEERLDFMERVLGRTREQPHLGNPSEK